jgi:uncharacterized protein (DUF433 family)
MVISNPQSTVPLHTDESGAVRVSGTRVTLDTILAYYQQGYSAEQIAEGFDAVPLADIHAVISFYLTHRAEVDGYLVEREHKREELRLECEQRLPPGDLRQRLLVRKAQRGL